MIKKIIGIIISILLVTGLGIFIYYKATYTKRIVEKNNFQWDILRYQNDIETGEYLGFLYEQNYNVNTLPQKYVAYLLLNYYITYEENFFNQYNEIEPFLYQTEFSKEAFDQKLKEMFGPSYPSIELENVTYGCGRSLYKMRDDYYLVQANDLERCRRTTNEKYLNHIDSYQREDDIITINMKVAYSSQDGNENMTLYKDKTKTEILESNYSSNCLNSKRKACYQNFMNYKVTLKKASDGNYYFYGIEKE